MPKTEQELLNDQIVTAVEKGQANNVRDLLGNGADVEMTNQRGTKTLLGISAGKGDITTLNILLEFKADPNKTFRRRTTPLMLAASSGKIEVVNALLAKEADVNAANRNGETPLSYAASTEKPNSSFEISKLLISSGADIYKVVNGKQIIDKYPNNVREELIGIYNRVNANNLTGDKIDALAAMPEKKQKKDSRQNHKKQDPNKKSSKVMKP